MKLILVRHGHVAGIDPPRFRGRQELPLTDLGRRQAELTAAAIAARWPVDAIYTSSLGRCVETGAAIAAAAHATMSVLPDLIDLDYGEWSWLTHEEVRLDAPELHALWFSQPWLAAIPGGETLQTLIARAANAFRTMLATHPTGTIVAVAHDTTNRALLLQCLGMPLDGYWRLVQSPCCINEIDIEGGRVLVERVNETAHLQRLADLEP
jgi:probable phosphoglycerate mutase